MAPRDELALKQGQALLLDVDELAGRGDLGAQRGLLDRRLGDIGGERQIGGLFLIAGDLGLGVEGFDEAAIGAPDIRREADIGLLGEEGIAGLGDGRRRGVA